jgi:hypothetical protein
MLFLVVEFEGAPAPPEPGVRLLVAVEDTGYPKSVREASGEDLFALDSPSKPAIIATRAV